MQGWAPPAEFDEYRLLRPIDRGAMGQVFLAHDTLLRRTVAVKFIAAADPGAAQRERFLVEARAIARLLHPNVVTIFRVGEVEGRPYLVSEYVRGEPLHRLPQPLPPERLLPIALGLGRGLAAAHRRGVLHRDVKPQNAILAEDGEVKLLDFGVAKLLDAEPAPGRAAAAASVSEDAPPAHGAEAGALDATAPHRDRVAAPPEEPTPGEASADESPRTAAGALVGTPLYMAPEIWAGEAATPRSDVYSFGALLYQLASGRPPHSERALPELAAAATGRDAAPLATLAPAQDGRLCAVVDRCLRRDAAARFGSGVELLAALEALLPAAAPKGMLPAGNPYRGLHCFEAEQRALFFGREREIAALLELLRGQPLLLLTGDSGVGKSSLCRAGLLPRIEEGALGEGRSWTALRLQPGPRPLLSLAAALRPLLDPGGDEEALGRRLAERPEALPALLAERLGDRAGLVLFWDQLEELLTLAPRDEAAPCARLLGQLAARVPPVRGLRVLGTVRGDFLGRLAALPGLLGALEQGVHVLGPPSPEALREAIVGPARLTGVRFGSEALVDTLVEATVAAEGGLPLLQFALSELWELRDRAQQLIPASAFAAIGGVSGALARHADSVLQALPAAERQAARRLLTRLVTAQGTRLRCGAADLLTGAAGERGALEALVRGRLLRALDAEGGAAYELAHEALIAGWGTLRELLSRDGERRAARQRVEAAAAEWERLGRAPAALWSAVQLRELDGAGLDLSELGARGRDFAQASRRALRRARLRRLGLLLGAPLVALLGYGALRLQEHRRLDRAIAERLTAAQAVLAQARAAAQAAQRARQGAFALFDESKEEPAEARWAEALGQVAAARAAYQQAGRALETALLLDTSRGEARRALATCLYEHALLEEAAQRPEQRDALLQRLATYDDDGELRRREQAPATLELAVTPEGARASLARYAAQPGGRRALQAPRDLGAAGPGLRGPLSLPPGSYLLTLSAPGRAEVRYPVLLTRGERLRAALRLPKANEVPPGLVYVPPGRFLYGSADADNWRRAMLTTQPLHALWLPGFLIGRHEVTFADWLAFLDALPPAERERRRPRVSAHNGGLDLSLGDGGAALSLGATSFRYRARAGEPLRYRDRDRRAAQDWRRFPVSGVSWDDAQAYLAWLDRSGRVPGARLCHEREWERAARGADDRVYPHGDELAPDDANHDVTYGRRPLAFGPDEVGAHPVSDSPFGVADLAGNAWEWVRPIGGGEVLYRGGGWYNGAPAAVATNRQAGEPAMRNIENGLRVCAPPPAEEAPR